MKKLIIPFIGHQNRISKSSIENQLLQNGTSTSIRCVNWSDFSFKPEVNLFAGYCNERLWLFYNVAGDYVKADFQNDQDPVWQDSCVEFFIKVGQGYMNFEFNALGTSLAAFGEGRGNRRPLSPEQMQTIVRYPSLTINNLPNQNSVSEWSLTVGIPLSLMNVLKGHIYQANFYKCGDFTATPHYLSWNEIHSEKPDFHRPDFFGEIELR